MLDWRNQLRCIYNNSDFSIVPSIQNFRLNKYKCDEMTTKVRSSGIRIWYYAGYENMHETFLRNLECKMFTDLRCSSILFYFFIRFALNFPTSLESHHDSRRLPTANEQQNNWATNSLGKSNFGKLIAIRKYFHWNVNESFLNLTFQCTFE